MRWVAWCLDLAPEVGRWLFGAGAGPVVSAVQDAVGVGTGAHDPAAQAAALMDPEKAAALRVELARIAAGQEAAAQAALVAQLSDVAGARAATLQLAQVGSAMAWGAAGGQRAGAGDVRDGGLYRPYACIA